MSRLKALDRDALAMILCLPEIYKTLQRPSYANATNLATSPCGGVHKKCRFNKTVIASIIWKVMTKPKTFRSSSTLKYRRTHDWEEMEDRMTFYISHFSSGEHRSLKPTATSFIRLCACISEHNEVILFALLVT